MLDGAFVMRGPDWEGSDGQPGSAYDLGHLRLSADVGAGELCLEVELVGGVKLLHLGSFGGGMMWLMTGANGPPWWRATEDSALFQACHRGCSVARGTAASACYLNSSC